MISVYLWNFARYNWNFIIYRDKIDIYQLDRVRFFFRNFFYFFFLSIIAQLRSID